MKKVTEFLDKLDAKPKKLLIGILIGLALLLVGSVFWGGNEKKQATGDSAIINETRRLKEEELQKLEKRMEDILSKVKGAGRVKVMLTSRSSSYFVLAQDEKSDTKAQTDGSETSESSVSEKSHLMVKEGSNTEAPFVIKEYEPEIEGVLILCEGAEHPEVKLQIYNAAKSLTNVSPSKIEVTVYDAK